VPDDDRLPVLPRRAVDLDWRELGLDHSPHIALVRGGNQDVRCSGLARAPEIGFVERARIGPDARDAAAWSHSDGREQVVLR